MSRPREFDAGVVLDRAAEAFRAGEAELKLEDGARFRITLLGHSTGSQVAYFEMRI